MDWLEHLLQRAKDITEEIREELQELYPKDARCTYRTWNMKNDLPGTVMAVDVYQNRPLIYVKPDHKPRGRWLPAKHVHCSNAERSGASSAPVSGSAPI